MLTAASQIDSLLDQLRRNSQQAETIFKSHTPGQLQHAPSPGRWSAAQCLAHLNLTNTAYLSLLDSALEQVRRRNILISGPFHMDWNARLLKYWLEPPSLLRMPTTAPFQVVTFADPQKALAEFQAVVQVLRQKLNSARGLALDRVKVTSPFAERMQYSVYSAFTLIAAHNRRHLWQAERALAV
jgi:hypothetical protein